MKDYIDFIGSFLKYKIKEQWNLIFTFQISKFKYKKVYS